MPSKPQITKFLILLSHIYHMGKTIRISDEIYQQLKEEADATGKPISKILDQRFQEKESEFQKAFKCLNEGGRPIDLVIKEICGPEKAKEYIKQYQELLEETFFITKIDSKLEQLEQRLEEGETREDFINRAVRNEINRSRLSKEEVEKMRKEERKKGFDEGYSKCEEEYTKDIEQNIEQGRELCKLAYGKDISAIEFMRLSSLVFMVCLEQGKIERLRQKGVVTV